MKNRFMDRALRVDYTTAGKAQRASRWRASTLKVVHADGLVDTKMVWAGVGLDSGLASAKR